MKTCLLILLLSVSLLSFSQVKVGIFAGPQIIWARYAIQNVKQPTDYKYGFQAGINLKVPFDNRLYFAPALYYTLKGYKVTLNNSSFPPDIAAVNNNTRIHTLAIAPLLDFDFTNKPSHFFIQAGPSIEIALAGKEKFTVTNGQTINRNMKFDFGNYGLISASGNLHFGYEAQNGFMIFAQYALGMGNANNADNGPQINYRAAGISIGKYLGRK